MALKKPNMTARYVPHSNCLQFQTDRSSRRYANTVLVFGAMQGPSLKMHLPFLKYTNQILIAP